jgi:hypothetical protein
MTHAAHFGELSAQLPSVLLDAPLPSIVYFSGLLGNRRAQGPTGTADFEEADVWLWTMLRERLAIARPESKLAILKRYKLTPEGRERRIEAALAALEAPQPTVLRREQWREIVEEIEDEDEE